MAPRTEASDRSDAAAKAEGEKKAAKRASKKKAKDKKDHDEAEAGRSGKMKRKEYERQMRILQGELVAMQEWVKDSGAKICIVFEGRDGAGKGGDGWFSLTHSVVSYDHPHHALGGHGLRIPIIERLEQILRMPLPLRDIERRAGEAVIAVERGRPQIRVVVQGEVALLDRSKRLIEVLQALPRTGQQLLPRAPGDDHPVADQDHQSRSAAVEAAHARKPEPER